MYFERTFFFFAKTGGFFPARYVKLFQRSLQSPKMYASLQGGHSRGGAHGSINLN